VVYSSPSGIDCGAICTRNYLSGRVVTLTPLPSIGSTFTGWSGACSGTGTCTITVTGANSVTASFSR